jgi:hypothetical protein
MLARALKRIPLEYPYGLSRIELRARHGNGIGAPFAAYRPDEEVVVLYSLPVLWVIDWMSEGCQRDLETLGARVSPQGRTWHVRWRSRPHLALWFFKEVVVHKLGHHFAEQYENKRGRIRGIRFRERNADLHSLRLTRAMFARARKRSSLRKADGEASCRCA